MLPLSAVGAPHQRLRVNRNPATTPISETPDRKDRVFKLFLSPAKRMKKAVVRIMSSGPIAYQFISLKLITISMGRPKGSGD